MMATFLRRRTIGPTMSLRVTLRRNNPELRMAEMGHLLPRRSQTGVSGLPPITAATVALAVLHRLYFVMPARNAFVHAFLAVRLIWLNERKPQWLIALRARPEAQGLWRRVRKRIRHRYHLGDSSDPKQ